jgi:replicative DNA helicase
MAEQKKFETPANIDAEVQVIGCLFIDSPRVMRRIDHLLKPSDFFLPAHQHIYTAFSHLYKEGVEGDLLTVFEFLKSNDTLEEAGGTDALSSFTTRVIGTANCVEYAKTVAKYATLRRVLKAAREIAAMTQNPTNIDEMLTQAEETINSVTRSAVRQQDKLELVDLQDYMTQEKNNPTPEGVLQGLSTGISKIDKMTQGFLPGELMIISGQTSHGKTQLSNNIILNAVRNEHKVMFVTMEMTKGETAKRFISLTEGQDIGKGKVFLNMRSDLAYTDVTKLIERAKEKGCELVVIDHLHYFSRSVENATQEVSKIVKEFKQAAVQYEMPVILICHVRKMSPAKHPTLEDLRDSSLIAQDADMVLIVWRDEAPSAKNPLQVEVSLWKNRNRQKKHRRDYLYAVGLKLDEEDKNSEETKKQAQIYAQQTAKILGERDDDLSVDDLDW